MPRLLLPGGELSQSLRVAMQKFQKWHQSHIFPVFFFLVTISLTSMWCVVAVVVVVAGIIPTPGGMEFMGGV